MVLRTGSNYKPSHSRNSLQLLVEFLHLIDLYIEVFAPP
jgi:hypothetical protein